jgi:hypothetical protein
VSLKVHSKKRRILPRLLTLSASTDRASTAILTHFTHEGHPVPAACHLLLYFCGGLRIMTTRGVLSVSWIVVVWKCWKIWR